MDQQSKKTAPSQHEPVPKRLVMNECVYPFLFQSLPLIDLCMRGLKVQVTE